MFSTSCKDHGTLGHFRTLLGRFSFTKDPKKDVNGCVDLLVTVFTGHIVAAACTHLGITDPSEKPSSEAFMHIRKAPAELQKSYIFDIAGLLTDNLTLIG